MLDINWSDVISTIASVRTQLIALGVILAVAVLVTLAANRRAVKKTTVRKLVRSETWIVAAVASIATISTMLFGPLSTMLALASGSGTLTADTIEATGELAGDIQREGIVLLENDDDALPLSQPEVNVFGWASTNPIYGGTGSGSMNDQYDTTSILEGMQDAGIEVNADLTNFYTSYRADRPVLNVGIQDWTLPEPPAAAYTDELIESARSFSDTALVVLGRSGGEGFDLPDDMGDMGANRQFARADGEFVAPGETSEAQAFYQNNSAAYDDFDAGQGYLELSRTERDMLDLVTSNFGNVVVVYNGANTLNLSFVDEYESIRSVLWAPPAGQTGFSALGEILTGAANPSGRTTDTFIRDFSAAPWANNFGQHPYDNMDDFAVDTSFQGQDFAVLPSFVNYVEGIYVGYKYYETADDEDAIDYDAVVQYPFGHGLSYTTFAQEMGEVINTGGRITFDVTVTNTGAATGKDVVQTYVNPPYTNGGIEKSSVNLVDIAKTDEIAPGQSQTITVTLAEEDLASYDADVTAAYVLEQGEYVISVNADAHDVLDEQTLSIAETITYSGENHRASDTGAVTNKFDDIAPAFEILSRADGFANYDIATAPPTTAMPEKYRSSFVNSSNYEIQNDDADEMPTTGADNGIDLYELYGLSYDDPAWDDLLDQLTIDEMNQLVAFAGYGTADVGSIAKPRQSDVDGPSTLNNNFTGIGSIGLPSGVSVANTFNTDLARQFGEAIGRLAHEMDVTGWYAPAMNIHRTAYAGRNFEYFSEDGFLSGVMAAEQVAGARSAGVYAFIKHFALNDQETNRVAMLSTWADEQTMREIYFKPFELAVKDGGATAVMSAFNYIGNEWTATSEPLLKGVLRDEWGFRGFVLTDYFGGFGYQIGDQAMRAGNDAMLATIEGANVISDRSATSVIAMREASHNILYTAVNSWQYENGQPEVSTPAWQYMYYSAAGLLTVVLIVLQVVTIRRFLGRRRTTPEPAPAPQAISAGV